MSWFGAVSQSPRVTAESEPPRSEYPEMLVTVPDVMPMTGSGSVFVE